MSSGESQAQSRKPDLNARVSRRRAVLASAAIVILVLISVAGSTRLSGPELFKLTDGHGIHLLDVFVMAVGGAGLLAVWWPVVFAPRREEVRQR